MLLRVDIDVKVEQMDVILKRRVVICKAPARSASQPESGLGGRGLTIRSPREWSSPYPVPQVRSDWTPELG